MALRLEAQLVIQTAAAIADAAGTALQRNADPLTRGLFRALKRDAIPAFRMEDANTNLAELAQAAIVNGWRDRLWLQSGDYRAGSNPNKNRLHGYLGRALADRSMTSRTSSQAISFLNPAELNDQARHWHRVNYGAFGPVATPNRTKRWPINIAGHTIFTIQDPDQPDPNSWLPRSFITDSSLEYFAPTRMKTGEGPNVADVVGGGHRSALFTELGFQSVATNLEFQYSEMLERWVENEGAEAVRRELHAQGVRIPVTVLRGP